MQVTMRPQVNLVGGSESRIRSLEEEVRQLRKELTSKEQGGAAAVGGAQLSPAAESVPTIEIETRLEAQRQQNQELLLQKEALARCA